MQRYYNIKGQNNMQGNFQPEKVDVNYEERKENEYRNKDYEDGVSVANIKIVMEYTKCEREDAINALKKFDDDPIEAIMSFVK